MTTKITVQPVEEKKEEFTSQFHAVAVNGTEMVAAKAGIQSWLEKKIQSVEEGGEDRHFLAALCSHPLAWWEGTHVGAYPPTDEVIAHLLLIRSDEHDLWKRSGQHGLNEVQAGI